MIAAAGSGQRLGAGGPKAFVDVAGRPLLEWSVRALRAAGSIGGVIVAVPEGFEGQLGEGVTAVTGGPSRAESVRLAMAAVDTELVVVHDAARPLLTAALVDRVVGRLSGSGAAGVIAAAPVADTLKLAGEGERIAETVDRRGLWAAQTPQAFRCDALRAAQGEAAAAGYLDQATDEAWLIERSGGEVLLEAPEQPNLKVTTAADVSVAAALLAGG